MRENLQILHEFGMGVLRRWYVLLPGILLDPVDIAERLFKVQYEVPSAIAWALVAIGLCIAAFLTYRELRKSGPPPRIETKLRYTVPPVLPESVVRRWEIRINRAYRARHGYSLEATELRRQAAEHVRKTHYVVDLNTLQSPTEGQGTDDTDIPAENTPTS